MSNILVRNDELKHYGILGMRWGTRRFQRRDGTLTRAGVKRYGEDEETATAKQKKNRADETARSLNTLRKYDRSGSLAGISALSKEGQNALANFEVSRSRRALLSDIVFTPTVYSMPIRAAMAIKRQQIGQKYAERLMVDRGVSDTPYSQVKKFATMALKDDAKARKAGLTNVSYI